MTITIENFGGNVQFEPAAQYAVQSEAEVLSVLQAHPDQPIRAVGSLHAWSPIAETDGVVIEMKSLDKVVVSKDRESAWVGAGCKVRKLLRSLANRGLTLPSVGLIDQQSVSGATATGTHGSGSNSLSHFIKAVRIAHFDRDGVPIISVVDSEDDLRAARCSLGLMGVIVAIEIECRPQYSIEEHARAHHTLAEAIEMEANFPKQQFYLMPWSWKYFGHHRTETQKRRSRLATLYRLYCFFTIDLGLHIAITFLSRVWKSAAAIRFFYKRILPLTIIRNWHVVDDSHAMLTMKHDLFRHLEIEVFVPRCRVQQATDLLIDVVAVFGGQKRIQPATSDALLESAGQKEVLDSMAGCYVHHYPICFRRILPDQTMLTASSVSDSASPDEDWYAISFISYQSPEDRDGFHAFANFIGPLIAELFGGRCHWGKYNPLDRIQNECLYSEFEAFRQVVRRYDSEGNFSNNWLDETVLQP